MTFYRKQHCATQSHVKKCRDASLRRTAIKSNKLTTDKVCSVQTTVRNHNINDAVRMKHTTKESIQVKSIQVTQVYHMQCALNNVTRKVNINASSSTATTSTEMQTLGRANTTCTSHKKTRLLQLTSNHKTKQNCHWTRVLTHSVRYGKS